MRAPENGERKTENGAPLRGDGRGRVTKRRSRRPIRPIRPICPTTLSKTASVGNRRLRRLVQIRGVLPHADYWEFGSLEAWKLGNAARLSQRPRRTTKIHKEDCQNGEPQISQILSRLRACYRTQDCQCGFITKCTKNHKGHYAGAKRQIFHGLGKRRRGAGRACA